MLEKTAGTESAKLVYELEPDDIRNPNEWWLFCLGHNFDVVATILTMAHLSWQRGWDAREVLENFFDDKEIIADFRENERHSDADNS